ncbi:MAG: hypothetical protein FJX76_08185 [Armatimonadetes bacterium]|nr:hypothetical protein [Armatimonadota bacterium]
MEIDPETLQEIRAILKRDCVVEVTVAFFDQSEGDDALDPIDIASTVDLDAGTPAAIKRQQFNEMLDTLKDLFEKA